MARIAYVFKTDRADDVRALLKEEGFEYNRGRFRNGDMEVTAYIKPVQLTQRMSRIDFTARKEGALEAVKAKLGDRILVISGERDS